MINRYRLGWKAWLPGVIGWLIIASLLILFSVTEHNLRLFLISIIFIALSVLTCIAGFNSWIEVCPKGIGGNWNNQKYFIPWHSIHALWVEKENTPAASIRLGTDLGLIILSLRGLPAHSILRNVRLRLPPNTQTEQAQQIYTTRRQVTQGIDHLQVDLPLEIGHSRRLKLLFSATTVLWIILIGLELNYHIKILGLIICGCLLLLNLLGNLLLAERVKFDAHGITQKLLFSTHHISWDEIQRVRIGATAQTVVIEGQGKRLWISGLRHWSGKQAKIARKYFLYQIDMRKITPDLDRWVEFKVLIPISNSG